jgi:hypothetical protein
VAKAARFVPKLDKVALLQEAICSYVSVANRRVLSTCTRGQTEQTPQLLKNRQWGFEWA